MPDVDVQIRCQRCGTQMDMVDPARGGEWKPNQFWVCETCGRHFWTTYPPPKPAKPAAPKPPAAKAEEAKPVTPRPTAQASTTPKPAPSSG